MLTFQQDYGLRPSGDVDVDTWAGLVEASWSLGERLLHLRSPNLRGDDVADLQSRLSRLGFDCGRVDGIYGPATARALSDFQANIGLDGNGICSPDVVDLLSRLGSQSGEGPGISMVRQTAALADATDDARIVWGHFPGCSALVHACERRSKTAHVLSTTVDADASAQAHVANQFRADCYIGFETSHDEGLVAYYYEVPTFTSVGGRNLATRIADAVGTRVRELPTRAEGIRHQVLRETRMPAVLCSIGPADFVTMKTAAISAAVCDGLDAWLGNRLGEP